MTFLAGIICGSIGGYVCGALSVAGIWVAVSWLSECGEEE